MDEWFGVIGNIGVFVVLGGVLVVGAIVRNRKSYDMPLACRRCGEDVHSEQGARCTACGFSPSDPRSPAQDAALDRIQQLAIAISALDSADREFRMSRRTSSGDNNSGPFPERYLEGMEQMQEARQIALDLDLEPVLHALSGIEAPEKFGDIERMQREARDRMDVARKVFQDARKQVVASWPQG